jgi:N-acetylmuramoyl-L-alanine amidase
VRRWEPRFRLAASALIVMALCLTASAVKADTLTPVRLQVDGKEITLKVQPLFDGHEVYLPLESLRAFGISWRILRREESALLTFSDGVSSEIALAHPRHQPMLPLSLLANALKLKAQVENGVCNIRRLRPEAQRESGSGSQVQKGEPASAPPPPPSAKSEDRRPETTRPGGTGDNAKPPSDIQKSETLESLPVRPSATRPSSTERTAPATSPARPDSAVNPSPAQPARNSSAPATQNSAPAAQSGAQPAQTSSSGGEAERVQTPQPLDGLGPYFRRVFESAQTKTPETKPAPVLTDIRDVILEPISEDRARLRIVTAGRVGVGVRFLRQPTRLAIDIPNTRLASETRSWSVNHPLLSEIRAQTAELSNTTRLELNLSKLISYSLVSSGEEGLIFHLTLPRNAGQPIQDLVVVIDPGHGGSSTGCSWPVGGQRVYEKHLVLSMAKRLREIMEQAGVNVIMTRTEDVDVSLSARPAIASDNNAHLFISLHIDDCRIPNSASGTTVYYHKSEPSSRTLAHSIVERIAMVSGLPNRGARSDTVLYTNGLAVLRESVTPAVLIEVGYINHATDRAKLMDARFQQRIAQAIFDGIRGYVESALPERRLSPIARETESRDTPR